MKITKLTIALLLILSCIIGVSACHPVIFRNHVHSYASEWNHDDDSHWKVCTVDGCTEISGKVNHTFGEPVVTEAEIDKNGTRIYTCKVCDGTKTETIPALEHTHTASSDWISNSEQHWNLCENGCDAKLNATAHAWDSGKVTVEATSGKEGSTRYTCVVCQSSRNETIPALPEKMSEAEWLAHFIFDNVRIDATFILEDFGSTEGIILIDGEYAEVTSEGESYISTSEQELADIDFSSNYNDFNHIGDGVYYASRVTVTYEGMDTEFSNVTVTFADEKIASISYTMDLLGMSCEFVFVFSEWGNIIVEAPTLSPEKLAEAMNPENFISYNMEIIEYDANLDYILYDYVFDNDSYTLSVYTEDEESVTEGNVENAGIVLNFPLALLNQLSADDFVYDSMIGAFVLEDPSILKDTILTFAITVDSGYLTNVYIAYNDGSETTYYMYGWGNEEENKILTEDMYAEILDSEKYYNYTYEMMFMGTDYSTLGYTCICDGDAYLYTDFESGESSYGELENAGIELHPLLEILRYIDVEDFVYDSDSDGYYCSSSEVIDNSYLYIVIVIEDGYLTAAYGEDDEGVEYYFFFYNYGTSVVE